MTEIYSIILAAGVGSRMKSKIPKVLHQVAGVPMVQQVLNQVSLLKPTQIITVVGSSAELIKNQLGTSSDYVFQEKQLGTGHAVLSAKEKLSTKVGQTLILAGDTPLITAKTLEKLLEKHLKSNSVATILTAQVPDPTGYGRIIRDDRGQVQRIVEQKDATYDEQKITEINTGIYLFDNQLLFSALEKLTINNVQQEYYLTDVIEILREDHHISAVIMDDFTEGLGVNDRIALAQANKIMFARNNLYHQLNGVTLLDPETTYIESTVEIGQDTIIEPNVSLVGRTKIGSEVIIGRGSQIIDSVLADQTKVLNSVIEESIIHKGADVGPFAHLRPHSELGEQVHIGNFVEVKASKLGAGTKSGHLTYIGNAEIGQEVNVGAGVIFVNYDGKNKFSSTVDDYAFIGSNSNLIAPITVGKNSLIAAGSTVTNDVAEDDLTIARTRQVNKKGVASKYHHYHQD